MKIKPRSKPDGLMIVMTMLLASGAFGQTTYNQATTSAFATGTNLVEKSATTAPNDIVTFSNLVKAAFATNSGGVFDFPTAVATGTTLYRGTYAGSTKRLHITIPGDGTLKTITHTNPPAGPMYYRVSSVIP